MSHDEWLFINRYMADSAWVGWRLPHETL